MPEHIKKIPQKMYVSENKMPESLEAQLKEPETVVYSILNDILNEKFGFNLYEYESKVKNYFVTKIEIKVPVITRKNHQKEESDKKRKDENV